MTLVVFIPHRDGFSLVADRQNTYQDWTVTTTCKLFCFKDRGVAIGCSGLTASFKHLMTELRNRTDSSSIVYNMQTIFKENFSRYNELAKLLGEKLLDIELIFSKMKDGFIEVGKLNTDIPGCLSYEPLDDSRCWAIGSIDAVLWLEPQLNRKIHYITKSQALEFGLALLSYAARVNKEVGPPEQYGCDTITVTKANTFEEKWIAPKLGAIDMLLPKFEV